MEDNTDPNLMEEATNGDPKLTFNQLPEDALRHIMSFLPQATAVIARQVHPIWRAVVDTVPIMTVREPVDDGNDADCPAGVYHLTATDEYDPAVHEHGIRSVSVIHEGARSALIGRIMGEQKGRLRRVDFLRDEYQRFLVDRLSKLLPQHAHLCELHLVSTKTSSMNASLADDDSLPDASLQSIVSAVGHQLRVLSVPDTDALGGIVFPRLETLTLLAQPFPPGEDGCVRHEPLPPIINDNDGDGVPLRIVATVADAQYDSAGATTGPQYAMITRYVRCRRPEHTPIVAPRLHTVTVMYDAGSRWRGFSLPGELPCDQVRDLTLVNVRVRHWGELLRLPLPRTVRLTVRDLYSQRADGARLYRLVPPPVARTTSRVTVPIWCVAAQLRELNIVQTRPDYQPFPLHGQLTTALRDAYPALARVNLVDCMQPSDADEPRGLSELVQAAQRVCWNPTAVNPVTRLSPLRYAYLTCGGEPRDKRRIVPAVADVEHRTKLRYNDDDESAVVDVSYRLLQAKPIPFSAIPLTSSLPVHARRNPHSLATDPANWKVRLCERCCPPTAKHLKFTQTSVPDPWVREVAAADAVAALAAANQ